MLELRGIIRAVMRCAMPGMRVTTSGDGPPTSFDLQRCMSGAPGRTRTCNLQFRRCLSSDAVQDGEAAGRRRAQSESYHLAAGGFLGMERRRPAPSGCADPAPPVGRLIEGSTAGGSPSSGRAVWAWTWCANVGAVRPNRPLSGSARARRWSWRDGSLIAVLAIQGDSPLARQLCGHEELQHRCLLNSEVLEPVGGDGW